ncbi:energy transducer TonB [Flavobacterium sp.]|uniref:energy transducer TonB n=1 Tax=Flavobacterium sp. TaxID=239 RepID=UPI00374D6B1B
MSKLNINKNEWLELVFEGKNKEYGAYQLRQDDGKTTIKAFFSAIALITGIAILPLVLSSFADKPVIHPYIEDPGLEVTNVILPPNQIKEELPVLRSEPQKPVTSQDLIDPTIVKANEAPDVAFTKPEEVGNTNTTNTNTTGTGVGPNPGNIDTGTVITVPAEDPEGIKPSGILDKSPTFPGGIDEFLKTVGRKFVTPEIDEEKTIKILVYFVIEKDGTLSNITVPKNPGFGLDKEAIRVLKSIKTKWEPGIYKGKPVRTSYSLPIMVKMQQE